jgi:hypothetical protein
MTTPDVFLSPPKNRYFTLWSSKIDEDGIENCVVRELFPNIDPIWRVRVNGKWEHPQTVKGQTYRLDSDTSHVEEFANSLTQVEFHKSKFIRLESPTTLYERGDKLANAITVELKHSPDFNLYEV